MSPISTGKTKSVQELHGIVKKHKTNQIPYISVACMPFYIPPVKKIGNDHKLISEQVKEPIEVPIAIAQTVEEPVAIMKPILENVNIKNLIAQIKTQFEIKNKETAKLHAYILKLEKANKNLHEANIKLHRNNMELQQKVKEHIAAQILIDISKQ